MTPLEANPETALEEWAELERLALAATPGPWFRGHNENGSAQGEMSVWPDADMVGGIIAKTGWQAPWDGWFEQPAKDTAFIAAANPSTVLALIAAARANSVGIAAGDAPNPSRPTTEDVARVIDPDGFAEWGNAAFGDLTPAATKALGFRVHAALEKAQTILDLLPTGEAETGDQTDAWAQALYRTNRFYTERHDWSDMASPDGGIRDLHTDMARAAKAVWDAEDPALTAHPKPAGEAVEALREKIAEIVEAAIGRHFPNAIVSDTLDDADAILSTLSGGLGSRPAKQAVPTERTSP